MFITGYFKNFFQANKKGDELGNGGGATPPDGPPLTSLGSAAAATSAGLSGSGASGGSKTSKILRRHFHHEHFEKKKPIIDRRHAVNTLKILTITFSNKTRNQPRNSAF